MHRIVIEFSPERVAELTSRALDFAEDLYRYIEMTGNGTVSDISYFAGRFDVTIHRTRWVNRGLKVIRETLGDHGLTHDAVVRRE